MSDFADDAAEREEFFRDISLRHRKPELKPCGACHNCTEPIKSGVFCSIECREDYELRNRK